MAESINRGQLRWRASRHALLELDVLFQRFIDRHFENLSETQLVALDAMLKCEDQDLWEMVCDRRPCSDAQWMGLIELLRER